MWTCGGPAFERHRDEIERTFAMVTYNDHEAEGHHQPLMIAADEVVADPVQRARLIEGCWIQHHWSPMITRRGAFFCEVAATFDGLFNGPGGFPLEKGWWRRGLADIQEQRARACGSCSIPLPIQPVWTRCRFGTDVSPRNAERLRRPVLRWHFEADMRIVSEVDLTKTRHGIRGFSHRPSTPHF